MGQIRMIANGYGRNCLPLFWKIWDRNGRGDLLLHPLRGQRPAAGPHGLLLERRAHVPARRLQSAAAPLRLLPLQREERDAHGAGPLPEPLRPAKTGHRGGRKRSRARRRRGALRDRGHDGYPPYGVYGAPPKR